jgi:hypothetical protein
MRIVSKTKINKAALVSALTDDEEVTRSLIVVVETIFHGMKQPSLENSMCSIFADSDQQKDSSEINLVRLSLRLIRPVEDAGEDRGESYQQIHSNTR